MKLIVNSDDFGYTLGISEGILYGNRHGIISSTTALINSPISKDLIDATDKIGVGLHLNLSLGSPILQDSTLSDENGFFLPIEDIVNNSEIEAEFEAQINLFITKFGRLPDHLDSHHGLHRYPSIEPIFRKLMDKYQLRARELSDVYFVRDFFGKKASVDQLIQILKENSHREIIEIMCHAGFSDRELESKSRYTTSRVNELYALTHPKLIEFINENNIEIISYGDIK